MTVAEAIDEWATKPAGFVLVEGRGWVNVQETARRYSENKMMPEWEASAGRFIQAVNSAASWCEDPAEYEMLEAAEPAPVVPWPLPWQTKFKQRRAS